MDAEGARALARRIAAGEPPPAEAAESSAPPPEGRTLPERISEGPASSGEVADGEDEDGRAAAAEPLSSAELRLYARAFEERLVDGRSVRVAVWWCRSRVRGAWQTPFVVREETFPDSASSNGSSRSPRA